MHPFESRLRAALRLWHPASPYLLHPCSRAPHVGCGAAQRSPPTKQPIVGLPPTYPTALRLWHPASILLTTRRMWRSAVKPINRATQCWAAPYLPGRAPALTSCTSPLLFTTRRMWRSAAKPINRPTHCWAAPNLPNRTPALTSCTSPLFGFGILRRPTSYIHVVVRIPAPAAYVHPVHKKKGPHYGGPKRRKKTVQPCIRPVAAPRQRCRASAPSE